MSKLFGSDLMGLGFSFMKRILIALVKLYQRWISPAFPPACRFYPSCSDYMLQALQKYSLLRALGLGSRRILKCNPFHPGGFDPLPD